MHPSDINKLRSVKQIYPAEEFQIMYAATLPSRWSWLSTLSAWLHRDFLPKRIALHSGEDWHPGTQPGGQGQHQRRWATLTVCILEMMWRKGSLLPTTHSSSLIMRTSDKSQPEDILHSTWSIFPKAVDHQKQGKGANCHGQGSLRRCKD